MRILIVTAGSRGDVAPFTGLTAETLSAGLRSCLDRATYRGRATELARRIRADDGPAAVLSLISRL